MPAKKSASKPEPEEAAPVFDEPVEETEPVVEPEPEPAEADSSLQPEPASAAPESEPAVHAGGHVLTEDKGWVPEEEL